MNVAARNMTADRFHDQSKESIQWRSINIYTRHWYIYRNKQTTYKIECIRKRQVVSTKKKFFFKNVRVLSGLRWNTLCFILSSSLFAIIFLNLPYTNMALYITIMQFSLWQNWILYPIVKYNGRTHCAIFCEMVYMNFIVNQICLLAN